MRFVGSKGNSGLWQRIISEMPPHDVYVEPFLGTGLIMRKKKPARASIGIDVDPAAPALTSCIDELSPSVRWGSQGNPASGYTYLCADALQQLTTLKPSMSASWLVYCDPPYLASVRVDAGRRYYRHEFDTEDQHRELISLLMTLPARVILSGYRSGLYDELLTTWRSVTVPTVTRGGGRSFETFWMNYPEPFAFHDTRYLGRDYRERERIKRKKNRWKKNLAAMSRIDRAAVLDAIGELAGDTVAFIDRAPPSKTMRSASEALD